MAAFITLKESNAQVLVNVANINFIRANGENCTIYFGKEHFVHVDHSAHAVIGMMLDAKSVPESK